MCRTSHATAHLTKASQGPRFGRHTLEQRVEMQRAIFHATATKPHHDHINVRNVRHALSPHGDPRFDAADGPRCRHSVSLARASLVVRRFCQHLVGVRDDRVRDRPGHAPRTALPRVCVELRVQQAGVRSQGACVPAQAPQLVPSLGLLLSTTPRHPSSFSQRVAPAPLELNSSHEQLLLSRNGYLVTSTTQARCVRPRHRSLSDRTCVLTSRREQLHGELKPSMCCCSRVVFQSSQ